MAELLTRKQTIQKVREWFSRPDAVYGYDIERQACVYRGKNRDGIQDPHSPVRCAFGCLIPDEDYHPDWDMNGGSLATETMYNPGLAEECFEDVSHVQGVWDEAWINHLQAIHDQHASQSYPLSEFLAALDEFEQETT